MIKVTKPAMQAKLDAAGFQHPVTIVPEHWGFHILVTEAELPLFREKVQSRSNLVWQVKKTHTLHQPTNTNFVELRLP